MAETRRQKRTEHELEFTRIVAFSDGVFAIAITLLVLQLGVSKGLSTDARLWDEIGEQTGDLVAYGISFAVIGRFWLNHHRFFGEIIGFDGRLIALNFVNLAFIVLIGFSSQILGEYGNLTPAVAVYALNMALASFSSFVMITYAQRANLVRSDRTTNLRAAKAVALSVTFVFLLSIPIAFVYPTWTFTIWVFAAAYPFKLIRRKYEDSEPSPG